MTRMSWRRAGVVLASLVFTVGVLVPPRDARAATNAQIEASISAGLEWLVRQQRGDLAAEPVRGSFPYVEWGTWYDEAATALALVKLVDRAKELNKDPFDEDPASATYYPYAHAVNLGFQYLFKRMSVALPPFGEVIVFPSAGLTTYTEALALMAVVSTNAPDRLAPVVAPHPLSGWTYHRAALALQRWLVDAQNDGECGVGGWGYGANTPGWADQSNAGYATIALGLAAAAPPAGFGIGLPISTTSGLETFVDNVRITDPESAYFGGSMYNPCPGWWGGATEWWANTLKAGNLLYELALVGDTLASARVSDAIGFIERAWNVAEPHPEESWIAYGWRSSYQAMFTMMKGLEAFGVTELTVDGAPIDWFDEVSTAIVANQITSDPDPAKNGGFKLLPLVAEGEDSAVMRTLWALLTLERFVPRVEFGIPDQCVPAGQEFASFDADAFVVSGTPPYDWAVTGAVELVVEKDLENVYSVAYPLGFTGTETLSFEATDANGQTHNDPADFTVDPVPVMGDVPDQIMPFTPITLPDFLGGIAPAAVTWSASGNDCLQVTLDAGVATVANPGGCTAPETIVFTATAEACGVAVSASDEATFTPNRPPGCAGAYPDVACLWPPTSKLEPVAVLGVTDPDGDPITLLVTAVTSDEATATALGAAGPAHAPDASGVGGPGVLLRAERSGLMDGRVYVISFTASDGRGGSCTGAVAVKVPHDRAKNTCTAVNSGQLFDATVAN